MTEAANPSKSVVGGGEEQASGWGGKGGGGAEAPMGCHVVCLFDNHTERER